MSLQLELAHTRATVEVLHAVGAWQRNSQSSELQSALAYAHAHLSGLQLCRLAERGAPTPFAVQLDERGNVYPLHLDRPVVRPALYDDRRPLEAE